MAQSKPVRAVARREHGPSARSGLVLSWVVLAAPCVALLLQHAPAPAWSAMVAYHAGCWLAATPATPRFGIRPPTRQLAAAAGLSAGIVMVGFAAARAAIPALREPVTSWSQWGLHPPWDGLILSYYVAVNPWIEERFWRGALLAPALRARLGVRLARAVAALGFVPMHVVVLHASFGWWLATIAAAGVLVASLVWTAWSERSRGLWYPAASHLGADLGLSLAYLLWLRS